MTHQYKMDTKIRLNVSIGLAGCTAADVLELAKIIDVGSQEDLDEMDGTEIRKEVDKFLFEWIYNYVDYGWSVED